MLCHAEEDSAWGNLGAPGQVCHFGLATIISHLGCCGSLRTHLPSLSPGTVAHGPYKCQVLLNYLRLVTPSYLNPRTFHGHLLWSCFLVSFLLSIFYCSSLETPCCFLRTLSDWYIFPTCCYLPTVFQYPVFSRPGHSSLASILPWLVYQLHSLPRFVCSTWYHPNEKFLILSVTSHQNIRSSGTGTSEHPLLRLQCSSVTFMSAQWVTRTGEGGREWRAGWEPWWGAYGWRVIIHCAFSPPTWWSCLESEHGSYPAMFLVFFLSVEKRDDDGVYVWTWSLDR